MNSDLHRGGQLKPKLVRLLFALALAQYAPAQGATSVDLVGVGGTFPLPIYAKWFAEYGTSNAGVSFTTCPGVRQRASAMSPTVEATLGAATFP